MCEEEDEGVREYERESVCGLRAHQEEQEQEEENKGKKHSL